MPSTARTVDLTTTVGTWLVRAKPEPSCVTEGEHKHQPRDRRCRQDPCAGCRIAGGLEPLPVVRRPHPTASQAPRSERDSDRDENETDQTNGERKNKAHQNGAGRAVLPGMVRSSHVERLPDLRPASHTHPVDQRQAMNTTADTSKTMTATTTMVARSPP